MKATKRQFGEKTGFTIIELLTVMSIIIILISVLVPGLNLARRYAKRVKQKAQFHSISVALEQFSALDLGGGYPESGLLPVPAAPQYTTGAQRLAEALMGRDRRGYDPQSTWDAQADNVSLDIYASSVAPASPQPQIDASLDRRKGPYLPDVAAFQVSELYADAAGVYTGSVYGGGIGTRPAPVLTDEYTVKNVTIGGKVVKAGSPILYYKANISSTVFPDTSAGGVIAITDPVADASRINSRDNEALIALGTVKSGVSVPHHFDPINYTDGAGKDGRQIFYEAITNPQMTPSWPVNTDSYILISAGFDGVFGTPDDVFNFGD
jgi:type II secretory pathway pseudopilin PulG